MRVCRRSSASYAELPVREFLLSGISASISEGLESEFGYVSPDSRELEDTAFIRGPQTCRMGAQAGESLCENERNKKTH